MARSPVRYLFNNLQYQHFVIVKGKAANLVPHHRKVLRADVSFLDSMTSRVLCLINHKRERKARLV